MTNNSILALFFFTLAGGAHLGTVSAQQPAAEEKKTEPASLAPKSTNAAKEETKNLDDEDENEGKLFFSFGGSRWKEVIEWLADSSDLALHYSDLPIGTFTYSDTKYLPFKRRSIESTCSCCLRASRLCEVVDCFRSSTSVIRVA